MHVMGSTEGKGRGSNGKQGVGSRITRGEKKLLNGGFGNRPTVQLVDNANFWKRICEEEGHRYHSATGLCVRCDKSKNE